MLFVSVSSRFSVDVEGDMVVEGRFFWRSLWKSSMEVWFSGGGDVEVDRRVFSSSLCFWPLFWLCANFRSEGKCGGMAGGAVDTGESSWPKSMSAFSVDFGAAAWVVWEIGRLAWVCGGGIGFFSVDFWPGKIGATAKICFVCSSGVLPLL